MSKEVFGFAVYEDVASELDEMVDACNDLRASRPEIVVAKPKLQSLVIYAPKMIHKQWPHQR